MNSRQCHRITQSFWFQITTVFILMATVIVSVQMSIFANAIKKSEDRVFERRLSLYKEVAQQGFRYHEDHNGVLSLDLLTTAYIGYQNLPVDIRQQVKADWLGVDEVWMHGSSDEFMVLATRDPSGTGSDTIYIVENISQLEASDEEGAQQIAIYSLAGVGMFALACLSMILIARRLTRPLIQLSNLLQSGGEDDLSLLATPKHSPTEIQQLVHSLNRYRQRLTCLIERERSFTSYASHELRTPLTVIRGVATLLGVSSEPSFVARQQQRLARASNEMNDVVETLLSLIRKSRQEPMVPTRINRAFVQQIIDDHQPLLQEKNVRIHINLTNEPEVIASEPVVRILLSNLIRNAMAHTYEGYISITLDSDCLKVTDSGSGLNPKVSQHSGYGIGLLIVNDICRKYGWEFSLISNSDQCGCTARIDLNETCRIPHL